ncbi:hypothetical protein EZH22_05560 [Xanthobacter dioxanivorans]|uniref:Uncharacterized protein n=1 Tax=Xanthobacter dioxanivorans TaxID=2528964 RepID=A0A974PQE9_9HYPH|nr:hypothetical protein EZH22_05560 [Xanthobacter dioxanivorans]
MAQPRGARRPLSGGADPLTHRAPRGTLSRKGRGEAGKGVRHILLRQLRQSGAALRRVHLMADAGQQAGGAGGGGV